MTDNPVMPCALYNGLVRACENTASAGVAHFEKEEGTIRKRGDGVEPAGPGTGSAAIAPGDITGEARQYAGLLPRILHLQKEIAVRLLHIAICENHRTVPLKGESKVGSHRGLSSSPLAGSNGNFHEENLPMPLGFVGNVGRGALSLPDVLQHLPDGALAILKDLNPRRGEHLKGLGAAESRGHPLGSRIHHILGGLNPRALSSVKILIVREIAVLFVLGVTEQKSRGSSKSAVHGGIQPLVFGYTNCDFHRILPSKSSTSTSTATSAAAETTSAHTPAEEPPASSEEGKGKRSVLRGIIHRSLRVLSILGVLYILGVHFPLFRRKLLFLGGYLLLRKAAESPPPSCKGPLTHRSCSISCWHDTYLLLCVVLYLERALVL
jgi:hypothetical protein